MPPEEPVAWWSAGVQDQGCKDCTGAEGGLPRLKEMMKAPPSWRGYLRRLKMVARIGQKVPCRKW